MRRKRCSLPPFPPIPSVLPDEDDDRRNNEDTQGELDGEISDRLERRHLTFHDGVLVKVVSQEEDVESCESLRRAEKEVCVLGRSNGVSDERSESPGVVTVLRRFAPRLRLSLLACSHLEKDHLGSIDGVGDVTFLLSDEHLRREGGGGSRSGAWE